MELVEGGIHVRRELFYGEPEVGREVSVLEHEFGGEKLQVGIVVGVGRRLARRLAVGTRDHERPRCGGRGFSGPGDGMSNRAEKVTAGAMVAEVLVAAGTVGLRGRVAARAVETAEVSEDRGCGAVRATKVARLAEARGCWAAGTGDGCREWAHSPDVYET